MTDPALNEALTSWFAFYTSCSELLMHGDQWLSSNVPRLQGAAGKTCLPSGGSASIDNPRGWIPSLISRVYQHPAQEGLYAWTGILLSIRDPRKGSDRGQALLTAGWAQFETPQDSYKLLAAAKCLWTSPEVPIDGSFHKGTWPLTKGPTPQRVRVSGLPLARVQSSADLEKGLLRPLLEDLQ